MCEYVYICVYVCVWINVSMYACLLLEKNLKNMINLTYWIYIYVYYARLNCSDISWRIVLSCLGLDFRIDYICMGVCVCVFGCV